MYQIDVGRVYVYPTKIGRDQIQEIKLPEGYDSILVTFDSGDGHRKESGNDNLIPTTHATNSVYSQYYMIFDETRIAPAYRVSF